MKAVILVGGRGTRLRPLTYSKPKQLLPVGGRPMIERVVERLAACGLEEVVLSLGYRPDAFLAAYPDGRCAGVAIRYAVEPEPLDTAGAVAFAAREVGVDETFVAVNGDVLTMLDVAALVEFHRARGAEGTLALTPVSDPSRYGVVQTDPGGRVLAFIEKPPAGTAPTNLINAGTYVLEPSVVERIPPGARVSIERVTFPELAARGTLYAQGSDVAWIDAGLPSTYLEANLQYAGPDHPGTRVDPTAKVTDSVLGVGSEIGPGAVIERSVVLDGASVGAGAVIRDSVVGWGSNIGAAAVLEAWSVTGAGVTVAAGQVLSGQRIPSEEE